MDLCVCFRMLGLHIKGIEDDSRTKREGIFEEDECIVQIKDTELIDKSFAQYELAPSSSPHSHHSIIAVSFFWVAFALFCPSRLVVSVFDTLSRVLSGSHFTSRSSSSRRLVLLIVIIISELQSD